MKRFLTIAFAAFAAVAAAQAGELKVWFDTPCPADSAEAWWESRSLPIGNGSIGASVMGIVEAECLYLNEKTLWRGGPNVDGDARRYWDANKQSAHLLPAIRQAFADSDAALAAELTQKNFNGLAPYDEGDESGGGFRFGNFTTAGQLLFATGIDGDSVTAYRRELSLDSALATVGFMAGGVAYRRQFFVSYPANVLVARFTADAPGAQNITFTYEPNGQSTVQTRDKGNGEIAFTAILDNNSMRYAVAVKAVASGGSIGSAGGRISVSGADEVTFYITADTDYKPNYNPGFDDPLAYVGVDPEATTNQWIDAAGAKGYDALLMEHIEDYTSLFNRVRLSLNPTCEASSEGLPTGRRLELYRQGSPDYSLEELYYQYGRYLLIASSRPGNMPANLQGIWSRELDGPWHVDYHNNINIQMNYWPAHCANLDECAEPLIDFIRTLVVPGRVTARSYFGAEGWTASISANIFGFTAPLTDENMAWNFNPMAGPWLATQVWDYYDYTRDAQWLRQVGYDIIAGAADFTADFLWRRPDGTYTATPSTSPEHGLVDEGATFAHAVAREILKDAIAASRELGIDEAKCERWSEVLAGIAPYKTGQYGQLMEWWDDIDDPADHHRHVNHLYGLHPGSSISPITTPDLAQAARVTLSQRGDGATGWSMGWKLNQWARLADGNHAYTLYRNLLGNGTLDNLWDTHPPFQIDGNFGGTAGVTEMLLQSHTGFIHLLPALPDAWSEGSVSGLCARGSFEVSIEWSGGVLTRATIISKKGGFCTVRYNGATITLDTTPGSAYSVTYDPVAGALASR